MVRRTAKVPGKDSQVFRWALPRFRISFGPILDLAWLIDRRYGAAVDEDICPVDVTRQRAGEKSHGGGDILGSAKPAAGIRHHVLHRELLKRGEFIRGSPYCGAIALSMSSTPGVTIIPGLIALDVMPVPANSLARLTARFRLAAFVAQ